MVPHYDEVRTSARAPHKGSMGPWHHICLEPFKKLTLPYQGVMSSLMFKFFILYIVSQENCEGEM